MANKTKLGAGAAFQPADFSIVRYAAKVPVGTSLADVTHPEFFANHLGRMRQGMRIEVMSEDMELDCELRVISVLKTGAKVRVLSVHSEPAASDRKPDEDAGGDDKDKLTVSFGGPHHKWRYGAAGKDPLETGFGSKADAEEALAKYLEELNG